MFIIVYIFVSFYTIIIFMYCIIINNYFCHAFYTAWILRNLIPRYYINKLIVWLIDDVLHLNLEDFETEKKTI